MPTDSNLKRQDSTNSRLPREVLGRIFMLGKIPTYPEEKGSRWSPMLVCRDWREAALSTAKLWTKIESTCEQLFDVTPSSLGLWMERSRSALLDVNVDITAPEYPEWRPDYPADHVDSVLQVLLAHTSRFGDLEVIAYPIQLTMVLQLLHRATRLTRLSIESFKRYEQRLPPNLYYSWSHTAKPKLVLPSLRNLTLNITEVTLDSLPRLDCPCLEFLHLRQMSVSFAQLRRFFACIPSVVCLQMTGITHSDREGTDRDMAEAWSDRERCEAFGHLTTITLDTLTCEGMYGADIILMGAKDSLIHLVIHFPATSNLPRWEGAFRSVKTLALCSERLWIHSGEEVVYEKQNICDVLESFPNLSSLELSWNPEGEQMEVVFTPFLQALSIYKDDGTSVHCCPSLSKLRLHRLTTEIEPLLEVSRARGGKAGGDFRMTLQECYGLPDIHDASYDELLYRLENMVEINLPFRPSWKDN